MAKNTKAAAAPIRLNAAFDLEAAPVNLAGLADPVPELLPAAKVGVTVAMVVAITPAVADAVTAACVPWTRPTLVPVTVVKITWGTVRTLEMTEVVVDGPLL